MNDNDGVGPCVNINDGSLMMIDDYPTMTPGRCVQEHTLA